MIHGVVMATEDACQEYASSLEDLTFNSKPLINVLTMLAEENRQHAAEIIKLIEKRIYEVKLIVCWSTFYTIKRNIKNICLCLISVVHIFICFIKCESGKICQKI